MQSANGDKLVTLYLLDGTSIEIGQEQAMEMIDEDATMKMVLLNRHLFQADTMFHYNDYPIMRLSNPDEEQNQEAVREDQEQNHEAVRNDQEEEIIEIQDSEDQEEVRNDQEEEIIEIQDSEDQEEVRNDQEVSYHSARNDQEEEKQPIRAEQEEEKHPIGFEDPDRYGYLEALAETAQQFGMQQDQSDLTEVRRILRAMSVRAQNYSSTVYPHPYLQGFISRRNLQSEIDSIIYYLQHAEDHARFLGRLRELLHIRRYFAEHSEFSELFEDFLVSPGQLLALNSYLKKLLVARREQVNGVTHLRKEQKVIEKYFKAYQTTNYPSILSHPVYTNLERQADQFQELTTDNFLFEQYYERAIRDRPEVDSQEGMAEMNILIRNRRTLENRQVRSQRRVSNQRQQVQRSFPIRQEEIIEIPDSDEEEVVEPPIQRQRVDIQQPSDEEVVAQEQLLQQMNQERIIRRDPNNEFDQLLMLEEQQHFEEDFDDNNETEDVEFDFDKELDIPSDEE